MTSRAFTFAAYNASSLPCNMFFTVRCVTQPGVHLESAPERLWNQRRLEELALNDEVAKLVNDTEHFLVAPRNVDLAVAEVAGQPTVLGSCDGPIDAPELRKQLDLRSLTGDPGSQRIKDGKRLALRMRGAKGKDSGLFRLLARRNEEPFLKGTGVLESAPFWLRAGEVRACTLRIDAPPKNVSVLNVELWREGTHGDRDRPIGELTFLFSAEGQNSDPQK